MVQTIGNPPGIGRRFDQTAGFFGDGMSLGQVMKTSVFFDPMFFWLNHWTITNFYQFLMYLLVVQCAKITPLGYSRKPMKRLSKHLLCTSFFDLWEAGCSQISSVNPVWPCHALPGRYCDGSHKALNEVPILCGTHLGHQIGTNQLDHFNHLNIS